MAPGPAAQHKTRVWRRTRQTSSNELTPLSFLDRAAAAFGSRQAIKFRPRRASQEAKETSVSRRQDTRITHQKPLYAGTGTVARSGRADTPALTEARS
jgi:hypothetical protein